MIMANEMNEISDPIEYISSDRGREPEEGMALCLSGGGYRAMLFHVGVLWRLNELGFLPKLKRVSSVSGGSITAGVLAMNFDSLGFDSDGVGANFVAKVVLPIKALASRTIDSTSVITGALWVGSIGDKVADSYRRHLFGEKTLQDITDKVRFVFNATNVQSGALWRFSKPYMRDYRVGEVKNPTVELAVAVAASSAFPPVLSPVELELDPLQFTAGTTGDCEDPMFRTEIVLTDGGVYDNLGLETAWKRYKTVFVSDAGAAFATDADPGRDWLRHTIRVLMIIDNQVRSLRRRQIVGAYKKGNRSGAFWSIGHDLAKDFGTPGALNCPFDQTSVLAETPTRLRKLDEKLQNRLINWGYAVCDASIRKHFDSGLAAPHGFPFPGASVG
ncbi:MAG: patatin-like phospholipase family protein [Acidobacteria bacterium]|nr:patatin-like phospholipase family protein [Acidobacteriota bacterium]